MDDDYYYRSGEGGEGRDSLFAWTVAILLLVGVAFACWILSFHVFGHPEQPFSYSVLKKLGKLDPPKRFELTTAPKGEFLTAKQLYERFSGMPEYELRSENEMFFRGYLRNYSDRSFKVPYVMGAFNILNSYELDKSDIFPDGVVALAQSTEFPAVLIEHLYTTDPANVEAFQRMLMTGLDLRLRRSFDMSAVVRVTKLGDGRLLFSLAPLLYGAYTLSEGSATLRLEPPKNLNVESNWPLTSTQRLLEADAKYTQYRKNAGLPAASIAAVPAATPSAIASTTPKPASGVSTAIVPVATPLPVNTPFADSAIAAATPLPVATPFPVATPLTVSASPPLGDPVAVPFETAAVPLATPPPATQPYATPLPVTPPIEVAVVTPAPEVALKPFLASTPVTGTTQVTQPSNPGAAWTIYKPGALPAGRVVSAKQAASLTSEAAGNERLYLAGQFDVTASGNNKVVLRPKDNSLFRGGARVRVIADYPSGAETPREGMEVSRGELRPFEIREIRRGSDGEINVYVREITQP